MFKLFKYFSIKEWILSLVVVLLVFIACYSDLQLPDLMEKIIREIMIIGNNNPVIAAMGDKAVIYRNGLIMLGYVSLSLVSNVIICLLAARIGSGLSLKLRSEVFHKVESFSLQEIDKFSTASLITRTTNDITQIQTVMIMMFRIAIASPITAAIAIFKAVDKSPNLSVVIAGAVFALITVIVSLCLIVLPKYRQIQSRTDELNRVTRENLTGIRVIRAYNTESIEEEKFDDVNKKLTNIYIFVNNNMNILMPALTLIMSGVSLAIVWFGSYLVHNLTLDYEVLTTFTQYAMQVIISFMMLSMFLIFFPRAQVSAKRVLEVLNTKNLIVDPKVPQQSTDIEGEVEFRNVAFRYEDASDDVVSNISFKVKKGETLAIIGATGSGKSTIINLIPRLYDVTAGEVLVDGVDVRNYKLEDLRNKIGYVPQKGVLFSGTIKTNYEFGKRDLTTTDMDEASQIAQASEFISKLDQQYDTKISQGGTNVSGGQRQRLSIARALIKKPEILIFDDSFSALDYKTDKKLRAALKEHTKNTTNIIVAQRIGTIIDADQIIVLDEGKIVGKGTHRELLDTCEVYQEIALSQLSKEELE